MDFVFAALANGKAIKWLNVVEDCTKEAVLIEAASRINGQGVADLLAADCRWRDYPACIRPCQGPEFTGRSFCQWAHANDVKLLLVQPGKLTQNAYVESFNGKFLDECLNENSFVSLDHARAVISAWRRDYNEVTPHSLLGQRTSSEFAAALLDHGTVASHHPSDKQVTKDSTK